MSIVKGTLYIVATPIGNLGDISSRARTVLQDVDLIVAEDPRHSRFMLNQFGISTKVCSYHDHNERKQSAVLIRQLQLGLSIALISDAGTPLICDPGYHLLVAAHSQKIKVIPVPGASALVSALSVAGFSADKFVFEGYLPARKTARQQRLELLADEVRTLVFYEAPHRLINSLEAMKTCFGGERQAVIAKEMTKLYENIHRGTLSELVAWVDKEISKGEFVIIVQGAEKITQFDVRETGRILKILLTDHSVQDAVRLTTQIVQGHRNQIYKLATELHKEGES